MVMVLEDYESVGTCLKLYTLRPQHLAVGLVSMTIDIPHAF